AEIAVALWKRHLRHNPANPAWPDRDRFVLSNGHGSMLLYSLLHLTGYALPMDELRRFRQLHSRTPGHPERGLAPGVETTTGPLGQGIANAVGMALAERLLAAEFNRPGQARKVAPDADLRQDRHRERRSYQGRHRGGARRAARRQGGCRHPAGARLELSALRDPGERVPRLGRPRSGQARRAALEPAARRVREAVPGRGRGIQAPDGRPAAR